MKNNFRLTKRAFNKGLGLAGILSSLPALSAAAPISAKELTNVDIALFDPRYKSSYSFAEKLGFEGAQILSTNLDIGSLWQNKLKQTLNTSSTKISGLTAYADIFLLENFVQASGFKIEILQKCETFEPHIGQISHHMSEDYLHEIKGEAVIPVRRELFAWVLERA